MTSNPWRLARGSRSKSCIDVTLQLEVAKSSVRARPDLRHYDGGVPRSSTPRPRRDAGRPRGEPIIDAVLTHTLEELATHGMAGLSIDRIARAAEVNKTSIYRRFSTREELVGAALERVRIDLGASLKDTGSLRGDLTLLVATVAAFFAQPAGRALIRAVFAMTDTTALPSLSRRVEHVALAPSTAMFDRARLRGEWRKGAKPELLLSVLVGALLHRIVIERGVATKAWIASLVDLVARGVSPE